MTVSPQAQVTILQREARRNGGLRRRRQALRRRRILIGTGCRSAQETRVRRRRLFRVVKVGRACNLHGGFRQHSRRACSPTMPLSPGRFFGLRTRVRGRLLLMTVGTLRTVSTRHFPLWCAAGIAASSSRKKMQPSRIGRGQLCAEYGIEVAISNASFCRKHCGGIRSQGTFEKEQCT
jgi:hypothetical protein